MTYAERLQKELNKAPSRVIYNAQKRAYDWHKEAGQKRNIR